MNLSRFNKTITAVAAGALAWGYAVVASKSGPITANEWMTGAGYLLAAVGVYAVPNVPAPPAQPPVNTPPPPPPPPA